MPELPEVETVKRGLDAVLRGAVIKKVALRRKDLRTPFPKDFAEMLEGAKIKEIQRRAKYLLFILDSGEVLIAHLGMTGRFSVADKLPAKFDTHDHVVLELRDGRALLFNDARRFGLMALSPAKTLEKHKLFAHLGPEPLGKDFTPAYLKKALSARSGPIKTVLMDQELVVGVGNIYASEALFLAKISPKRRAKDVAKQAAILISSINQVLNDAIESGGSSLRDFLHVSGEAGYFQHRFNVYGRSEKPCFICKTPLRNIRQAGRSTFFCKNCQK